MKKICIICLFMIFASAGNALAGYAERSAYARTDAFRERLQYAMMNASGMILAEPASTPHHLKRCEFAQKVDRGDGYNINTTSLKVTTDPSVGTAIDGGGDPTDAQIQNAVNAFWNQWSGVINTE